VWNTVVFQCIWSRVDIITTKGQIFICRAGGGQNSAAVYRDIAFAFALYVRPSRRREICPGVFRDQNGRMDRVGRTKGRHRHLRRLVRSSWRGRSSCRGLGASAHRPAHRIPWSPLRAGPIASLKVFDNGATEAAESPSPSLQARLHRNRSGPAVTGRRLTLTSPERHLK